jgi:N-methylhydantoinase A
VRRRWRFEVAELLDHRGAVVHPLGSGSVERAAAGIAAERLESVAVCLIHAYANPAHDTPLPPRSVCGFRRCI